MKICIGQFMHVGQLRFFSIRGQMGYKLEPRVEFLINWLIVTNDPIFSVQHTIPKLLTQGTSITTAVITYTIHNRTQWPDMPFKKTSKWNDCLPYHAPATGSRLHEHCTCLVSPSELLDEKWNKDEIPFAVFIEIPHNLIVIYIHMHMTQFDHREDLSKINNCDCHIYSIFTHCTWGDVSKHTNRKISPLQRPLSFLC